MEATVRHKGKFLVNGKIPERKVCIFHVICGFKDPECPTTEENSKPNPFSCAVARFHELVLLK